MVLWQWGEGRSGILMGFTAFHTESKLLQETSSMYICWIIQVHVSPGSWLNNYLVLELGVSSMGKLHGSDAELHKANTWLFEILYLSPNYAAMYFISAHIHSPLGIKSEANMWLIQPHSWKEPFKLCKFFSVCAFEAAEKSVHCFFPTPSLPSSVGIASTLSLPTSRGREITTSHSSLLYSWTALLLESLLCVEGESAFCPQNFSQVSSSSTLIFLEALDDISQLLRTFSFPK